LKTKVNGLHVTFCAYRPWALTLAPLVHGHAKVRELAIISSKPEFDQLQASLGEITDMVFFVGWSWIIPLSLFRNVLCLGMHPSDLPRYRGGSPLQHQIIAGATHSMASLFTITEEIDGGPIWKKERFSLVGDNMDQVLTNLSGATSRLLTLFLDKYPDISAQPQPASDEPILKRRTPDQSSLSPQDFQTRSARDLYNRIRSLTDPYPNAFLRDARGDKIFFTGVRFEEADKPSA